MRGPVLLILALGLLAPAGAAAALETCSSGCPAQESLGALASSRVGPDRAYDNASERPGADAPGGKTSAAPTLAPAQPRPEDADAKRPPEPTAEKKKDRGGLGGFLDRHKWDILGGLAGGLLTLFVIGGLAGLIAGLVVSVAIGYFGRKLEGRA